MNNKQKLVAVSNKHKKVSVNVKHQISQYVIEKHPQFVKFLEHYYEWMEQEDAPLGDAYRILDYFDIDKTKDEFLPVFIDEFMPNFPNNIKTDIRLLLKNITDFYEAKGTENSFKFLFRVLFNEEIEILYPALTILKASDGVWKQYSSIKVINVDNLDLIVGRKIFNKISGANAVVERIEIVDNDVRKLTLKKVNGKFIPNDLIETRDSYEKISTNVSGQVISVDIINSGNGYFIDDKIYYNDLIFNITEINNIGSILKVSIINSGIGLSNNITINNVNGKGAVLTLVVNGMYGEDGNFIGETGKLSSICKLQDGRTIQDFSYIIKSTLPVKDYYNYIMQTVHPAGVLFSGIYDLVEDVQSIDITTSDIIYDINIFGQYITFNDLQRQLPNQTLSYYLDQLLNNYIYDISIDTFEDEVSQYPELVVTFAGLEDGRTLITEDGVDIIY